MKLIEPSNPQRGATLITALIMLVVLTLLVISAINSSTSNLRIAGNMQMQEEIITAAQMATERVISDNFTKVPAPSVILVDINNDGLAEYTANVATPVCTGSTPLLNNTPNLPKDCVNSAQEKNPGLIFVSGIATNINSLCSAQQWDVRTQVTDSRTGANATMHQGVSLNVAAGTSCVPALPTP